MAGLSPTASDFLLFMLAILLLKLAPSPCPCPCPSTPLCFGQAWVIGFKLFSNLWDAEGAFCS